jgi:microcystin-dependent protein
MANPFVAEIRVFAGNFAPAGWAFCDGQVLPISQNTALFSLLGTTYGGDGKSSFALPNLQGRAPVQAGQGLNLPQIALGESGGESEVTLTPAELPAHTHAVQASTSGGNVAPLKQICGTASQRPTPNFYSPDASATASMNPLSCSLTGGGQPHNNMPPYLVLNFIIALQGVFPPRA